MRLTVRREIGTEYSEGGVLNYVDRRLLSDKDNTDVDHSIEIVEAAEVAKGKTLEEGAKLERPPPHMHSRGAFAEKNQQSAALSEAAEPVSKVNGRHAGDPRMEAGTEPEVPRRRALQVRVVTQISEGASTFEMCATECLERHSVVGLRRATRSKRAGRNKTEDPDQEQDRPRILRAFRFPTGQKGVRASLVPVTVKWAWLPDYARVI
eukprot:g20257.t1